MPDNVTLNPGTGGSTIATDDIGGVQHELVKLEFGEDGEATMVSLNNPLPVSATIDSTGLATETKQDDEITQLVNIVNKLSSDPATQTTLADILAKIIAAPATEAKQDTGNTSLSNIDLSLSNIDSKTPALGQNVASDSTPVVLTALQIATLTPQINALTNTQLRASAVPVSGTFFQTTQPVSLATNTPTLQSGSTTAVTQATGTNLHTVVDSGTISTITNVVHVDDNGSSLTVDAPVSTPVFVRLSDGAAAITTLPVSLATNTPTLQSGSTTAVTQATGTNLHTVIDSGTITTVSTVTSVTAIANALPAGTNAIGKLAANAGVDIGAVELVAGQTLGTVTTVGAVTSITNPITVAQVTAANLNMTEASASAIKTAVEVIDNFISGSRGLVTEDNSAAILAKMPTVGQTTNSASLPVTLSSDQVFPAGFLRVTDEPRQILYDPFDTLDTANTWALDANSGGVVATVSLGTMSLGTGTASGGYSKIASIASFKPTVPSWIGYSFLNIMPDLASPTTNAYRFFGAGTTPLTPTYSAPLTDAIGFELKDSKMYAVVYASGTRTVIQDLSASTGNSKQPTDASGHRYIIYIRTDRIYFYIDSLANTGLVATSSFNYPNIQTLPMLFLAAAGATIANSQIQSVGATVWDTGKNTSQITDGTYPWRKAKVNTLGELSVAAGVTAAATAPIDTYGERALNVKNNDERALLEKMYLESYRTNMMAISGNYGFELR